MFILSLIVSAACFVGYVVVRFLKSKESKEAGIKLDQCPYKIESNETI